MTYSIDAARALRLEAVGGDWEFEHRGETYVLPREFPLAVVETLESVGREDGLTGLRKILAALLGDQAGRFDVGTLSAEDITALFDAYGAEVGISLGESVPSSNSSESTARPSKPTSKPRMASASRKSTKAR